MLMIGSDATFGGRRLFFEDHGDYDIYDYEYALENGWIPEDYMVWWGFEDSKLFEMAKKTLAAAGNEEEPFNLTLLTVDTHFEDGYVCGLCREDIPDNQYANVMACSSRLVSDFVEWCKTQDWWDQTTVVLSGDHLTMDSDFCDEIPYDTERKTYTCIINSAVTREQDTYREFSTLDIFPTTIAALGCEIDGDRLGLGTNLYSDQVTLIESFGFSYLDREFRKHSQFMDRLGNMEENDEYIHQTGLAPTAELTIVDRGGDYEFLIYGMRYEGNAEEFLLVVEDAEDDGREILILKPQYDYEFDMYKAYADKKRLTAERVSITCLARDRNGKTYRGDPVYYDLILAGDHGDFDAYLERCSENLSEYTIFLSIYDEGTSALTDHQKSLLAGLGLQSDFDDGFRKSYYAVIDRGRCEEKMSDEYLECEGILDDGWTYLITSAGFNASGQYDGTNILLNDANYSKGVRGFNLAVYSNRYHCVMDSAVFDTFTGGNTVMVKKERLGTKPNQYVIPRLKGVAPGHKNIWLMLKPEYRNSYITFQMEENELFRWKVMPLETYRSTQDGVVYLQHMDGTIEVMKADLQ